MSLLDGTRPSRAAVETQSPCETKQMVSCFDLYVSRSLRIDDRNRPSAIGIVSPHCGCEMLLSEGPRTHLRVGAVFVASKPLIFVSLCTSTRPWSYTIIDSDMPHVLASSLAVWTQRRKGLVTIRVGTAMPLIRSATRLLSNRPFSVRFGSHIGSTPSQLSSRSPWRITMTCRRREGAVVSETVGTGVGVLDGLLGASSTSRAASACCCTISSFTREIQKSRCSTVRTLGSRRRSVATIVLSASAAVSPSACDNRNWYPSSIAHVARTVVGAPPPRRGAATVKSISTADSHSASLCAAAASADCEDLPSRRAMASKVCFWAAARSMRVRMAFSARYS
eukprot:PhM_4_TR18837/c0_g1_i1/m.89745